MSRTPYTDQNAAGYVECDECGHELERHSLTGCYLQSEGCTCTERWTVAEVKAVRRRAGLPARWSA